MTTARQPAKRASIPGEIVAFDRPLPHDLEAEKLVLGAILRHNDHLDTARSILAVPNFYRRAHQQIFAAMLSLADDRGSTLDFVLLKDELRRRNELDEVGGPAYLASLIDGLPNMPHVRGHATVVKEKFLLRELIRTGNTLIAHAYDGERAPAEILRAADTALLDLQLDADRRGFTDPTQSAHALFADIEQRVATKGTMSGVPSGFRSVDELTGGWQRGELIVLAARPSIGKTALALNFARAAAASGQRVALFSLEMKRRQLEYRLLSAISGVMATRLLTGYLSDEDYKALSPALQVFQDLPIFINDRARQGAADIRTACRRMRSDGGLGLVVIDYVQLMQATTERRGATRTEEVTDISRRLKVLADELDLPVILLSQLKRTGGARPTLEDLRESGSLEQDADIVGLIHRKNHKEGGLTNLMIEKQRNGPTGTVDLMFDRDIQRFEDGGHETAEAAAESQADADKDAKTRAIIRQRSRRR